MGSQNGKFSQAMGSQVGEVNGKTARKMQTTMVQNHQKWQPPTPAMIVKAVILCRDWRLNDEQRAEQLGICRKTLGRWRRRPDFQRLWCVSLEGVPAVGVNRG